MRSRSKRRRDRERAPLIAPQEVLAQEPRPFYGFRPFPKRGGIVTNEVIDRLRGKDK